MICSIQSYVESIFPPQSGLINIGINLGSIMLPDVATELKGSKQLNILSLSELDKIIFLPQMKSITNLCLGLALFIIVLAG